MTEPVVALEGVSKRYRIYRRRYQSVKEILVHRRLGEWHEHWALRDVNLEVAPGSTLGLVGPNGAGKSTALKLMARLLPPDRGRLKIRGRVSGLLELGAGFQLEYTGRENIYLNASLLGLTRRDIDAKLGSIVDFSELGDVIDDPLRTYSSGMSMRLAFSIAIHVDPDVLLVDEILAVGDQSFQQKCLDRIQQFQAAGGTIVIVSHNLGAMQELCTEVAWIEDGVLQEHGAPMAVVNAYLDRVRDRDFERDPGRPDAGAAVHFGQVRLLDRRGEAAGVLEVGDPLTVEIPLRVRRELEKPVLGVALFRNDGTFLYGTNTRIDEVDVPPLRRDVTIRFHYGRLPLLPGTYRISVGLFSARDLMQPIDFHDKLHVFRVVSASKGEEGLVRFDHEWEVESALSAGGSAPRQRRSSRLKAR